jgi:hypothetical protein
MAFIPKVKFAMRTSKPRPRHYGIHFRIAVMRYEIIQDEPKLTSHYPAQLLARHVSPQESKTTKDYEMQLEDSQPVLPFFGLKLSLETVARKTKKGR